VTCDLRGPRALAISRVGTAAPTASPWPFGRVTLRTVPDEYFTAADGEAGVVGDIRHFPVLIATWYGEPTEPLVRAYFKWSDEVAAEAYSNDRRYVIISDNVHARRPSPTVRKLVAALIDAGPAAKTERVISTFVVFESALVRGAVTAMQWLSHKEWNLTTAATVQIAITGALGVLAKHGAPIPARLSPSTYERPPSPAGTSSAQARR
jgi:hypothetical protein